MRTRIDPITKIELAIENEWRINLLDITRNDYLWLIRVQRYGNERLVGIGLRTIEYMSIEDIYVFIRGRKPDVIVPRLEAS